MQHNITGRLFTIAAVLLLALFALWPNPFKTLSPNLEQGLDMKGGVSLVYQIKVPPGEAPSADLSTRVLTALKQRVDPTGVRNFVWRPQGADRIEIQLPAGKQNADAAGIRNEYLAAEKALRDVNVNALTLLAVLDVSDPALRQQQLDAIVQGSAARRELVDQLVAAKKTKSELDAKWKALPANAVTPEAELSAYNAAEDALRPSSVGEKLAATNVDQQSVQDAIALNNPAEREARLNKIRSATSGFEARTKAIDNYIAAWKKFEPVRDSIDSVAELKALLRGSGVLSFHVVANPADPALPSGTFDIYRKRLAENGPRPQPRDEFRWYKLAEQEQREHLEKERKGEGGFGPAVAKYNGEFYQLLWITPEKSMINREGAEKWALAGARAFMNSQTAQTEISFTFDPVGGKLFSDLTGRHKPGTPGAPYQVAAVLDNQVLSAPNINAQIGDRGTISGGGKGGFSQTEAQYLEKTLSAGALPAQLDGEPIVERVIGPQLGADNLRRGLIACSAGVVVVAAFLICYYFLSGVVATIAVLLNLLLILAGMSMFGATFTLPGVAGIILTIGMAVDANVLIFERLREEQQRGLGVRVALHNAYKRAFSAIVDSNLTTAVSAIVLYFIGTEEVRGFGLTLLLGIVSSMFTALYVTRTVFFILTEHWGVDNLSSLPLRFPKLDRALRPDVDWMRLTPIFVAFSVTFVIGGLALFGYYWRQGNMLDIEFAGGTSLTAELKEPMRIEEFRKLISDAAEKDKEALPAPNVTSVGDPKELGQPIYSSYEIVTPNTDRAKVMSAVSAALAGKLNVVDPVRFDDDRLTIDQLLQRPASDNLTRVIAIRTGDETVDGDFRPDGLEGFAGGVAFVLENARPALDARQIQERLEQARLQDAGGSQRKLAVQKLRDGVGIVVLAVDTSGQQLGEDLKPLAGPVWEKIVKGLTSPAEFARVSGIDKSVANEAQTSAIGALVVSIVGIVIYIWVRFGDFKYGSATIVALFHDVLFGLAAIGFAHLLAESLVGRALMIDAFRINLTLVSGMLTIMGFSMNDTVVVFDRIRELRGQRGHIDRTVINDAVNQTLSRTILTGGTTIATILFMYCLGGEAIHGFMYVLFVGFMAGTYSSVAVAAPLLLIGAGKQPEQKVLKAQVVPAKA
jgi:SecD/SecF fusion protein